MSQRGCLVKPVYSASLATIFAAACLLSCVAPRGGWDVKAIEERTPALASAVGHRLGDMVPFPAILAGDQVGLVACRFATAAPVLVRGVPGASLGRWAPSFETGTRALSQRVPGLELRWAGGTLSGVENAVTDSPVIWVKPGREEPGKIRYRRGALGETQSQCDVAPRVLEASALGDAKGAVRGVLLQAAIRIRSVTVDHLARPRPATEAEWLGTLMHELGHAVGFVGHVATGESLMVREESVLRRWGRRAMAEGAAEGGEVEPTLAALYSLSPGAVLGVRMLSTKSASEIRRLRALRSARETEGVRVEQTIAMAGDRDARIEWRFQDGSRLGLWFRGWASALRANSKIEVDLDLETRRALRAAGL